MLTCLQVTWRKDLHEIDFFATDHKYMLKERGSLFIDKADVTDTARFLCVVENPAGVVTREITLTVHGRSIDSKCVKRVKITICLYSGSTNFPKLVSWKKKAKSRVCSQKTTTSNEMKTCLNFTEPPAISEDTPRNITIIETHRVTLPCPASGTPPPLITWYKDGREITGNVAFGIKCNAKYCFIVLVKQLKLQLLGFFKKTA